MLGLRRWSGCCALIITACSGDAAAPPEQPPPQAIDVPAAARAWLERNAIPFQTVEPDADLSDLAFLDELIGDARVVSLGEATHGTREFFLMKARILRYLVERMGFDAFAIEATWPEANRIDTYVREGGGDPAPLLSGLYFWTWNTESVLDMIEWMRAHNAAGGDVGFYGFDMQFPGMAIRNVNDFVAAVDGAAVAEFTSLYSCMSIHANDPTGRFPATRYASQSMEFRTECRADLRAAHDALEAREEAYTAASDARRFARALRSARVALQYEAAQSGLATRDAAMAENSLWLLDQLGPDGRIVLWSHNFHAATLPGAMGIDLRAALGDDMVVLGFSFLSGSFTAVTQVGTTFSGLATHSVHAPGFLTWERYFAAAGMPRMMLDLREVPTSGDSTAWLAGPLPLRAIGCCFSPGDPDRYWSTTRIREMFDVIIHIDGTTPSRVLPYAPPSTF